MFFGTQGYISNRSNLYTWFIHTYHKAKANSFPADMERHFFFLHKQGLIQHYFTTKKGVNFVKSEFATKQRKMYLTTSMSKTRLSHIYRGKNYVFYFICSPF